MRRVRTASGATAVQVAEYVDGRRRIVAQLGAAHTEAELGLLLERARGLLEAAGQGELDLGVEARPRRAGLVPPVDRAAAEPVLFTETIRNLVRRLRPLRSATIAINGIEQTFPPAVPADQQAILDAINSPHPGTKPNDRSQNGGCRVR